MWGHAVLIEAGEAGEAGEARATRGEMKGWDQWDELMGCYAAIGWKRRGSRLGRGRERFPIGLTVGWGCRGAAVVSAGS